MNDFSRENEERLLELLGQEYGILEQIRAMTEKQTELIAADDIDAFNKSLDRRQELITQINGLHQESDVLMQSYISFTASGGGSKISAVDEASGKIKAIVSECALKNEKNTSAAKEKAEEYIKQIGKLSLTRKSLGKYAQSVPNSPELFDKKT